MLGHETVLVVEDEDAIRGIAKRILSEAGYAVLTASDASDALLTCNTHTGKIHLLLTDVVMPQMGGRALAERVALAQPGIKVLYMSGYADDAIVHHGTLDPGTNLIAKPFSGTDLKRKVREVLDSEIAAPNNKHEPMSLPAPDSKESLPERGAPRAATPEVLDQLRRAVKAARYDEALNLADSLLTADPPLAAQLREMVEAYDYAGVLDSIGR
jgi:DNA-binding NtrC family response regulator